MMRWLILGIAAVAVSLVGAAAGQTTCSLQHPETGIHICFPPDGGANQMSPILHISAQINAPADKLIQEFTIFVDGAPVGQERERVPTAQVSVEGNLGTPLLDGKHLVTIRTPGVGEANAKIVVAESESMFPCDPVTNYPQWSCLSRSAVRGAKEVSPLRSLRERSETKGTPRYEEYERVILDLLESLQLDTMELAAFDGAGHLYVATHVHSDIEVRRYSPGGQKLEFATVISSCGPGFTALDAIAVDDLSNVWIGGHSSACFRATEQAFQKTNATTRNKVHSFVLSLSTQPSATPPPRYFTYLGSGEERIHAIRVDKLGNAYLAGENASSDFPHEKLLILSKESRSSSKLSFLAILNAEGSAFLHSTLLRGVRAQSLNIDGAGNLLIAGQTAGSASLANSESPDAQQSATKLSPTGAGCCALFAAALRPDLSAVTSMVRMPSNPIQGRSSLAVTERGEILLIAPTATLTRSGSELSKPSAVSRSLHVLTAASLRVQCSRLLSGSLPPSLIPSAAVESFAADASSPICAMHGR